KIMDKAGFPAGVVNVVAGKGSVIGKTLAANPKVAMVSLTGSTGAGQEVMRNCAENMARVSLELGGKAPSVVMADADLDLAVSTIIAAKAKNAGWVCTAPERIYVQKTVADAFLAKLEEFMQTRTVYVVNH
ncbi:MAG: aldehyde dehydrogenase family protein, partial [Oscillospiraceae bacterium]|nr:aldehyde dehydrogenase family protein [Oscillospiraceae bacterium]